MQSEADTRSTYNYTTLRFLVDPERDLTVPVGVLLWGNASGTVWARLPKPGERIDGVPMVKARSFLDLAWMKIEGWMRDGDLPYTSEALKPLGEEWWDHVRRLMRWTVQIGPTHAIDCHTPSQEIESLYESLVQPRSAPSTRTKRVDGAVGQALGENLSRRFLRGATVAGFGGREVPVLRCATADRGAVVVEAVNLASNTALQEGHALASRLLCIREGGAYFHVRFVLGYIAPPAELAGDSGLKDWIEHKAGAKMYDLDREADAFRNQAGEALSHLEDALGVCGKEPLEATST